LSGFGQRKGSPFDPPAELGFHCPVCTYDLVHEGEYDERLQWSELNGFLWCSFCKKDYPAPLCMRDIERATDVRQGGCGTQKPHAAVVAPQFGLTLVVIAQSPSSAVVSVELAQRD
jgi:hypothetical protein